jgi:DNA-binding response OmpR family regulator
VGNGQGSTLQADDYGAGRRILIADDNEDFLASFEILLEACGYEVRSTASGSVVLSLAAAQSFDALIIDIGLRDLSGYEVAQRLRGQSAHASALLVALSGWSQPDIVAAALAAGFDYFFLKPVDFLELEQLLRKHAR